MYPNVCESHCDYVVKSNEISCRGMRFNQIVSTITTQIIPILTEQLSPLQALPPLLFLLLLLLFFLLFLPSLSLFPLLFHLPSLHHYEPCSSVFSGRPPCCQHILICKGLPRVVNRSIGKPEEFVQECEGVKRLKREVWKWEWLKGRKECLRWINMCWERRGRKRAGGRRRRKSEAKLVFF